MADNPKNPIARAMIIVAILGLIGTIITTFTKPELFGLRKDGPNQTEIKWEYGNDELHINLEEDIIDAPTFLLKLFSEDFSEAGTIDWLKKNQNLYSLNDPDIISEIASLKYEDIVAQGLRDLRKSRKGPWAYQLDTVIIGIPPEEYQPKKGFANVCENGNYFTKKIRLISMDGWNEIEVVATGKYECPKQLTYPDIQLNASDAKRLFGTTNFSKYEQAMALILEKK